MEEFYSAEHHRFEAMERERFEAVQVSNLEKERKDAESREIEMRHMIGNVSHDLKTVSIHFSPTLLL
jgi:hypothetical protein